MGKTCIKNGFLRNNLFLYTKTVNEVVSLSKKWSTGKSQQLTDSVTVIGLAKYSEALKLGIFPNRNWPFVADSRADFAVENYRDN